MDYFSRAHQRRRIDCRRASRNGQSSLMLAVDGEMVGQLVYEDQIRPEGAHVIEALRRRAIPDVVMLTGINDAAALSYADVGIAMKNGTDLAQHSAHVVLMRDDLSRIVDATDTSRGAVKLIHQNYSIVVGLNLVALAMAPAGGLVRPELTALISNGSAVLASVNRVRPLVQ
ncbi:MAG: hypothetical protein ACREQE_03995 [Candidatus Binataceae bacterium]